MQHLISNHGEEDVADEEISTEDLHTEADKAMMWDRWLAAAHLSG